MLMDGPEFIRPVAIMLLDEVGWSTLDRQDIHEAPHVNWGRYHRPFHVSWANVNFFSPQSQGTTIPQPTSDPRYDEIVYRLTPTILRCSPLNPPMSIEVMIYRVTCTLGDGYTLAGEATLDDLGCWTTKPTRRRAVERTDDRRAVAERRGAPLIGINLRTRAMEQSEINWGTTNYYRGIYTS